MQASGDATANVAHSVDYDSEDVTHNPFADLPSSSSCSSPVSSPNKRGLYRRRISEQNVIGTVRSSGLSPRSKSRTIQETNGHPLGSIIVEPSASSSPDDSGVTRPRLRRLVTMNTEEADSDPSRKPSETVGPAEEDRLVLIHEVAPTDTLAGVSLTYGISMTELRRANQLWTSDSVHLRRILHIPLDRASKLKHVQEHPQSLQEDMQDPPLEPNEVPSLNIHRVPASRLSFFPPTSQTYSDDLDGTSSITRLPDYSKQTGSLNTSVDVLTHGNISSLFSAFPRVLPSSRDGFISRLSFDSGGTSGTPSSDEHEMDEMDYTITRRTPTAKPQADPSLDCGIPSSLQFVNAVSPASSSHSPSARPSRNNASTGGVPCATEGWGSFSPCVRTSQLEPSPDMHLPIVKKKSMRRASSHYGDLDLAR